MSDETSNVFSDPEAFGYPIPQHKRKCLYRNAFPCNGTCRMFAECRWAAKVREAA